ncbi:unnamed protein product [Rotaria sp. Silwood2]|nr:unnamed protein product [Rotaria sp. Silwood2]CAF4425253.1 unnamed protein product [Rotaria sp. Silwood2]
MDAYRLYTVVHHLVKYIDMLTNWYVKLSKKRFKGETTLEDCFVSLNVLCYILLTIVKLMEPFTPFLAEYMHQILRKLISQSSSSSEQDLSVHFQMIPKSQKSLVNKNIKCTIDAIQTTIGLIEDEGPLTTIDDASIESEDVYIVYRVTQQTRFEATTEQGFVVLLDFTADASMKDEGLIHEIASRVEKRRSEAKLNPTDDIIVYYSVESETSEIARVVTKQQNEIEAILKKPFASLNNLTNKDNSNVVITKKLPLSFAFFN